MDSAARMTVLRCADSSVRQRRRIRGAGLGITFAALTGLLFANACVFCPDWKRARHDERWLTEFEEDPERAQAMFEIQWSDESAPTAMTLEVEPLNERELVDGCGISLEALKFEVHVVMEGLIDEYAFGSGLVTDDGALSNAYARFSVDAVNFADRLPTGADPQATEVEVQLRRGGGIWIAELYWGNEELGYERIAAGRMSS